MSDTGKLKARQIVAGWPRGRSTSSPYIPETDDISMSFFGRSSWCAADLYDLRWDIAYTIRYHRDQAEMVDKQRSEYRRPTPAWLARKILAAGGLVIVTSGETLDTINLGEPPKPSLEEWLDYSIKHLGYKLAGVE